MQTGPEAGQADSDLTTPGGPQVESNQASQPTQTLSEQIDPHAADQPGNDEPVDHLRPVAAPETSTAAIPLDLAQGVTGSDAETPAATHAVPPKRVARRGTLPGEGHNIAPPRDTARGQARPGGVVLSAAPTEQDQIAPRPMSLATGKPLWSQAYQAVKADPEFSSLLDKYQETLKARHIESRQGVYVFLRATDASNYMRRPDDLITMAPKRTYARTNSRGFKPLRRKCLIQFPPPTFPSLLGRRPSSFETRFGSL